MNTTLLAQARIIRLTVDVFTPSGQPLPPGTILAAERNGGNSWVTHNPDSFTIPAAHAEEIEPDNVLHELPRPAWIEEGDGVLTLAFPRATCDALRWQSAVTGKIPALLGLPTPDEVELAAESITLQFAGGNGAVSTWLAVLREEAVR